MIVVCFCESVYMFWYGVVFLNLVVSTIYSFKTLLYFLKPHYTCTDYVWLQSNNQELRITKSIWKCNANYSFTMRDLNTWYHVLQTMPFTKNWLEICDSKKVDLFASKNAVLSIKTLLETCETLQISSYCSYVIACIVLNVWNWFKMWCLTMFGCDR